MSPLFSTFMGLVLSYAMLAEEKRLLMIVTILGPIFFAMIGILSSPLLKRGQWGSTGHKRLLFTMIFLFLAPFLLSSLFNAWYYWSFANEIPVGMSSSKNLLVIYSVGLTLGVIFVGKIKIEELKLRNVKFQSITLVVFAILSALLTYRMSSEYIKL